MPGSLGRPTPPPVKLTGARSRPLQTHLVAGGRLKYSGFWEDSAGGPVIRHLATGEIVAEYRRGAWSRPVRESLERAPSLYPAPVFPSVTVQLTKGKYF